MSAYPLPDDALDSDIAILGRKGGGKTYTAKGIVERLIEKGRRVLVLDPLGVWAGLRTSADGKGPGLAVAIFGGQHADLPLDISAAKAMADVLARQNVPAVIDLSELTKAAQQSFLLAFLHELRRVNTEALTIVLEEADVFAPQNPMGDDSKQLHGEIDWIARRGRFKGFRLISITQRPARLSKDVLTQCATLIAHKLPAPQDRDAVKSWVDGNGDRDAAKEVFDTLAKLDRGEAWVWAPEHNILKRFHFPAIRTLDTSSTPKAGESRIEPKTLAGVDLTAIRAALAATKQTAPDGKPAHAPAAGGPSAAEIEAIKEQSRRIGYRLGYQAGAIDAQKQMAEAVCFDIWNVWEKVKRFQDGAEPLPEPQGGWGDLPANPPLGKALAARHPASLNAPTPGAAVLSGMAKTILDVLRAVHPLSLTYKAAALRAGASPKSSAFRGYQKQLLESGEVIMQDDSRLIAVRGDPNAPQPANPIDLFASRLTPSYASMLHVIAKANAPLWKEDIAARAGVSETSSGLTGGLRELVALELIIRRDDGRYIISPDLGLSQ